MDEDKPLMTPAQVARLFSVDTKTVRRWAESGKIRSILTPGGHRRYDRDEIVHYLKWREN